MFVVNSHGSDFHVKAHAVKKKKVDLTKLNKATFHNQLMLTQLATDNFI